MLLHAVTLNQPDWSYPRQQYGKGLDHLVAGLVEDCSSRPGTWNSYSCLACSQTWERLGKLALDRPSLDPDVATSMRTMIAHAEL